ncbi:MAG: hypothetical protein AB3N18_04595 [Allomuricauda sp.]
MVCKKVAHKWTDENGRNIPAHQITERAKGILRRVTCDDIIISNARVITPPPKKKIKTRVLKKALVVQDGRMVEKEILTNQPTPITIDNFHIATRGEFIEIDEVPEGFELFFKSKKSKYYKDSDSSVLIRESDHWGYRIKLCDWFLRGYDRIDCGRWKKQHLEPTKIGMIAISQLRPKTTFSN